MICVSRCLRVAALPVQLTFRYEGAKMTLPISVTEQVSDVKHALAQVLSIPPSDLRLSVAGQVLDDSKSLVESMVKADDEILISHVIAVSKVVAGAWDMFQEYVLPVTFYATVPVWAYLAMKRRGMSVSDLKHLVKFPFLD